MKAMQLMRHAGSILRPRHFDRQIASSFSTHTPLFGNGTPASSSRAGVAPDNGFSFKLSPEQQEIKDAARKFAEDVIIPHAAVLDRRGEFSHEITKKMYEMGYTYAIIPEQYGGVGSSKFGIGLFNGGMIGEQLAFGCAGQFTTVGAHYLAVLAILLGGSEQQKIKYLGRLTEEPMITACCVTEPQGGSDVSNIQVTAVKRGGMYAINGTKMWISNAGEANYYVVLARTDSTAKSGKALTSFIVEADTPGIHLGKKESNMGLRSSDTRAVTFEDCLVPKENIIGGEGRGFGLTMQVFDTNRPYAAAGAVGVSQRAYEEATAYAMKRVVFGKPIIEHQAISGLLADMACDIEASRLLYYRSYWGLDQGEKSPYFPSLAKTFASEMAQKCTANAVQIFGAYGFNQEYPVEKLMRDAKIFTIYEGTTQIQRLIIAREIIQRHKDGSMN